MRVKSVKIYILALFLHPISQTLQIVQGEHSENNYKLESIATMKI
jgi:hypothetical protein